MSADGLLIRGVGGRQAVTACAASTKLVFTGGPGRAASVYVVAYASIVYVKIANLTDADPVPSSTDYDFAIPAATTVLFPWTEGIAIWAQSAGNVSAVQVIG